MKILVIDDSPIHQQSARQTLTGHDLTVVGTYDEAYELLKPASKAPFEAVLCDLLMPAGAYNQVKDDKRGNEFVGQEMPVGFGLALQAVLHGARYVVVVSDTNHHSHPAAAMLDRLDSYGGWKDQEPSPVRFEVNGARMGFIRCSYEGKIPVEGITCMSCGGSGKAPVHSYECNHYGQKSNCPYCAREEVSDCSPWQYGKDWGKFLTHLLAAPITPHVR